MGLHFLVNLSNLFDQVINLIFLQCHLNFPWKVWHGILILINFYVPQTQDHFIIPFVYVFSEILVVVSYKILSL